MFKSDAPPRERVSRAGGKISNSLKTGFFSSRKLLCSIWLGRAKHHIFRALLSVHYLQFCDSGAFHLTRCREGYLQKCVDLGHLIFEATVFSGMSELSRSLRRTNARLFSRAYEEILLSIFQSLKSLKNLDDGKNGCLLEGRMSIFRVSAKKWECVDSVTKIYTE